MAETQPAFLENLMHQVKNGELSQLTYEMYRNCVISLIVDATVENGTLTWGAYPKATAYKVYYGESADTCNIELDSKYIDKAKLTADISSTATTVTQRLNGALAMKYYQVKAIVNGQEIPYVTISTNQILIASAVDFNNLRSFATEANGYVIEGYYYLTKDLDFSGTSISPINANLSGTIDGNGHVIRNLSVQFSGWNQEWTNGVVGGTPLSPKHLFASIYQSGTIRDICFDNYQPVDDNSNGGLLCHHALFGVNMGTVENVVVRLGQKMICGFSGLAFKNNGKIENCIVDTIDASYYKGENKGLNSISAFISVNNTATGSVNNCYSYSLAEVNYLDTTTDRFVELGIAGGVNSATNSTWYVNAMSGYLNTTVAETRQAFTQALLQQVNSGKLSQTAYDLYLAFIAQ